MRKLKVSAVSYLNTKPFLYGLQQSSLSKHIDMSLHIPSQGAQRLIDGKADIGLIPAAVFPQLQDYKIITDYCIGSVGAVETVVLFSQVPIEEIDTVLLDFHSRTSAQLVQILLREHWKQSVEFLPAEPGFEHQIQGKTAALVIGDRVFKWRDNYQYQYDLAEAWQQQYQLPFTFAIWVAKKSISNSQIQNFNQALAHGIANIPEVVRQHKQDFAANFNLLNYLSNRISYEFDQPKQAALQKFLLLLKDNQIPATQTAEQV